MPRIGIGFAGMLAASLSLGCAALPGLAPSGAPHRQVASSRLTVTQDQQIPALRLNATGDVSFETENEAAINQASRMDTSADLSQTNRKSPFSSGEVSLTSTNGSASAEFSNEGTIGQKAGREASASITASNDITVVFETAPKGNVTETLSNEHQIDQKAGKDTNAAITQVDNRTTTGLVAGDTATDTLANEASIRQRFGRNASAATAQTLNPGVVFIAAPHQVQDYHNNSSIDQQMGDP
jgi:hypothetical protein